MSRIQLFDNRENFILELNIANPAWDADYLRQARDHLARSGQDRFLSEHEDRVQSACLISAVVEWERAEREKREAPKDLRFALASVLVMQFQVAFLELLRSEPVFTSELNFQVRVPSSPECRIEAHFTQLCGDAAAELEWARQ